MQVYQILQIYGCTDSLISVNIMNLSQSVLRPVVAGQKENRHVASFVSLSDSPATVI